MNKKLIISAFVISIITLSSFTSSETETGRKFIGTETVASPCQSYTGNGGEGSQIVTSTFYLFGIPISSSSHVVDCNSGSPIN